MAFWLRLSGWVCFLLGGGIFLLSGGFSNPRNPVLWVGMFTALLGMILTSASNLAASIRQMRRGRKNAGGGDPAGP